MSEPESTSHEPPATSHGPLAISHQPPAASHQPLDEYLRRIRELMPDVSIDTAELNRDGMANDVVVINRELVFRFPKTEYGRRLQRYEAEVLQLVGRSVTTPVPQIELEADNVWMYRYLDGTPLYRYTLLRLGEYEQAALIEAIGIFLAQLHAIPLAETPVRPDEDTRPSPNERYLRLLHGVEERVYPLLWSDQRAYIGDLFAPLLDGALDLDDYVPAFVHNDLAVYHLLCDLDRVHLTGVLDFGTAGPGDPASDLACLISAYGERVVRMMAPVYPIDPATLDRARFLVGALELEWALIGVRDNDLSMLLVHLGRARDHLPVGLR